MRHDAPFVVKRFAPPIGRPNAQRRVVLEHNAYSMAEALDAARGPARRRLALEAIRGKEEGGGGRPWLDASIVELERTATWIERRDQSATLARKRSGRREGAP